MGKQDGFIWRDVNDPNMYHFGVQQANGTYVTWFSVFVDGMTEMFGTDWHMLERVVHTTPTRVNLEISL